MTVKYMLIIKFVSCFVFLTAANYSDVKSYKVKNKLILVMLIYGVIINAFNEKAFPVGAFAGAAVPLLLFPLFVLRMLGAGDIKLFCGLSCIMGSALAAIYIVIFSFIGGGVVAAIIMALRKNGKERCKNLLMYLKECFIMGKLRKYDGYKDEKGIFRFSFCITLGMVFYAVALFGKMI